jgi:hypothetical protein
MKGDAMRAAQIIMRCFAWVIIAMLTLPPEMLAQESGQPEQTDRFKNEELVQMLAPIALYPDSLISQILMASTYPLEVVEAERWLHQNKGLQGDALDNALKEKTWDPSVKSLCHFPDVLFAMSEKLDQTRKLGDAFLSQEDDVMAAIQELRRKAEEEGNLQTTKEQDVIDEEDFIRIEPADPQLIYVPQYDPYYVYGPWWYPAYPPYYWYNPQGYYYAGGFIGFGLPVLIGFGWFSWSWFDWNHHHIDVDYHKAGRFHRFDSRTRDFDRPFWRHDPGHRRGVAYRDTSTSLRFGSGRSGRPLSSPEMRGYPAGGVGRQAAEPSRRTIGRREGTATTQGRTGRERIQSDTGRYNTFRGIGNGNFERRASERGGISRQGPGRTRQSGDTGSQGRGTRGGGGSPGRGGGSGGHGGGGSSGRGGSGGFRR